jgi:uncharacterized protein YdaU (DUF1376 family)
MVAFFKRDIAAWMDGTENLSDGAYRAYDVICNLIYLSEGPITLNERGIAGRCRQRLEDFRRYVRQLTEAKKIVIVDGKVFNRRCADELAKIEQKRGNSSRGGHASVARRSQPAQPPPASGSVVANERLPDNTLKTLTNHQVPLALDETDYPLPPGGRNTFQGIFQQVGHAERRSAAG